MNNDTFGSVFTAAPEMYVKDEKIGKRVDCWALGGILYELCTLNPIPNS